MFARHGHGLIFVLAVTGLGLMLGCAGTGINKGDISFISIDEEWQLGEQLAADIADEMRLVDNPQVSAYITRMGNEVLAQAKGDTPIADRPWDFHVVAGDEVNAFNIPGGHVYFYSGLIARADNYGEVMGVMAHEVSHGLVRHGVENMTKQYGISMLAGLVLGKDPAAYQEILANILAGGAIMKFSRRASGSASAGRSSSRRTRARLSRAFRLSGSSSSARSSDSSASASRFAFQCDRPSM